MRCHVEVRSEGPVTAGDLICPPEVEIVNPELLLLTADSPEVDLDIELTVSAAAAIRRPKSAASCRWVRSRWMRSTARCARSTTRSRRARIGQQTNYDRLVLEIWTDGTMAPEAALRESAKLLVRHLTLIAGADVTPAEQAAAETRSGVPSRIYDVPIEELELTRAGLQLPEARRHHQGGRGAGAAGEGRGRDPGHPQLRPQVAERIGGEAGRQGLSVGHRIPAEQRPGRVRRRRGDLRKSLKGAFVMRHRVAGCKLGRNTSQRNCLAANLITELFRYDRIQTTEAKARSMRGDAEHLITVAKRSLADGGNPVHAHRLAAHVITDPDVTKRLFDEVARASPSGPAAIPACASSGPAWATAPRWSCWSWWNGRSKKKAKKQHSASIVGMTARLTMDQHLNDAAHIRATVAYDGTDFLGFQWQTQGRTVQGVLEARAGPGDRPGQLGWWARAHRYRGSCPGPGDRLSGRSGATRCPTCSGRSMPCLPMDVAVLELARRQPDWHPRFSARRRHYRYTVLNRPAVAAGPALRPSGDAAAGSGGAAGGGGSAGRRARLRQLRPADPGRQHRALVFSAEWRQDGPWFTFDVVGNAFLRGMVRAWSAACSRWHGRLAGRAHEATVLAGRDRALAAPPAPACGLCLMRV